MAPTRRPKAVLLPDALASRIKATREERGWTQAQLAERMTALGFGWSRSTVTEVEGSGRRRQVSVGELLGLAEVFGTGILGLVGERVVEVTPAMTLTDEQAFDLLMGPDFVRRIESRVQTDALTRVLADQLNRMAGVMTERIQALASELRSTADWFETEALDRLRLPVAGNEEEK